MPTLVFTDLPEVSVDFNSTSALGRLRTSSIRGPETWDAVVLDRWVLAVDEDGNRCAARVAELHGSWAELEPNWPTWVASDLDETVIPLGSGLIQELPADPEDAEDVQEQAATTAASGLNGRYLAAEGEAGHWGAWKPQPQPVKQRHLVHAG